jgi:uncharacterized protein YndB with AHSA1/START domain
MTDNARWTRDYAHEIAADADLAWRALADPAGWPAWNAGVLGVALEGPFARGTWFSMTLPDGMAIRTRLLDVEPARRFVDETWIEDTVVRVDHRLEVAGPGRCRVTFAVEAEGPSAAAMGEGASADFPDVLASLARFVEARA